MIRGESLWKQPIHFSSFKYALDDIVESICHTRFDSIWVTIMISIWWYLYFLIIYHFLTRSPFTIFAHKSPLVFFLMKIVNIFVIHQKIRISHISVLNLISIAITVYYIWNLYCFIISMCIVINIPHILNLKQYHSNQYLSSTIIFGASIST